MWFLLWRNDWGAEFVLIAPALVDPTYTTTGRLYSKQTVLCIKLSMDIDPFTTRIEDKRSLYKIMKYLCRDSIFKEKHHLTLNY